MQYFLNNAQVEQRLGNVSSTYMKLSLEWWYMKLASVKIISVKDAVLGIIWGNGSVCTHHLLYFVTAWHGENQIPSLPVKSETIIFHFLKLCHSGVPWHQPYSVACARPIGTAVATFLFSHSLKLFASEAPFFRTVVCAQQHQQTSISAAARNWWCHYIPTKYNNAGNQRKLHVFQKANNLIAGCNDSVTCSPSPPDRLSRVPIRRWSTAPCSKKRQNWRCVFPP